MARHRRRLPHSRGKCAEAEALLLREETRPFVKAVVVLSAVEGRWGGRRAPACKPQTGWLRRGCTQAQSCLCQAFSSRQGPSQEGQEDGEGDSPGTPFRQPVTFRGTRGTVCIALITGHCLVLSNGSKKSGGERKKPGWRRAHLKSSISLPAPNLNHTGGCRLAEAAVRWHGI
ncbi:hypothetical protein FQA47_020228 [Oryzias melastigma]|uniref:Uncharacterized protein n=1 Tax=Oryzias melastigma TaxID=30732 RepID=A0A834BY72_ORYME|nr:hypothetical protein FQA47_020228 [Oryzias melastigma]